MALVVATARPRLLWHKGYFLFGSSVPQVSKCFNHTPFISFQLIFSFDCYTPLSLYTKIYLFLLFEHCGLFFTSYTNLPHPLCPSLAVSQPERRNVRLDGCNSGNVPFQSAFTPEISSLIPLRLIPAKTGIWWEGNVAGWGEWESRIQSVYKDGAREEGKV